MATATSVAFSTQDRETLEYLQSVLYSFLVRNKNQHRRSIWWRQFSTFRRQVDILTKAVVQLYETPTTNLLRTRKKAKDREIQADITQRLQFWQDVQVPKWQHAFSQVIADGRFAVLGLVLYATLAQICKVTGLVAKFEDLGQAEMQRVLEAFGKEHWQDEVAGLEERSGEEDFGEVVQREEDIGDREETTAMPRGVPALPDETAIDRRQAPDPRESKPIEQATKTGEKRNAEPTKKAPKKKKKKGNAIDDLFSGL
ncbi:hypothetical protein MBLNU230_g2195t1 [Neophaeotheca triangularis]